MLKGSLKLIKDAKKKKEVVVESSHVEDEEVETEKQEENLVSEVKSEFQQTNFHLEDLWASIN